MDRDAQWQLGTTPRVSLKDDTPRWISGRNEVQQREVSVKQPRFNVTRICLFVGMSCRSTKTKVSVWFYSGIVPTAQPGSQLILTLNVLCSIFHFLFWQSFRKLTCFSPRVHCVKEQSHVVVNDLPIHQSSVTENVICAFVLNAICLCRCVKEGVGVFWSVNAKGDP